jgi:Killing trait
MAFPTAVNDQITDAVTQSNVKVLGDAPAQALGTLYQSVAQALSTAAQNAVTQQQNGDILAQAATTRCVNVLLGASTARSKP